VTVLIALFAFLTYARSKLPDVPVTTIMDRFIFASVAMTCMALIQTVFTCKAGASTGPLFRPTNNKNMGSDMHNTAFDELYTSRY
jgi:hypothetical protein